MRPRRDDPAPGSTERGAGVGALPRGVWVLGLVSLLMDTSSELIHSLLPVFLVSSLGASAEALGAIEGIAEATASLVKVYSGALSDRLGRRLPLAVAGYGLAALSKPLFALAPTVRWVLGARVVDRVGKGLRGAPRDALIADLTPARVRGAAFGLRQGLDTVGAMIGPVAAALLLGALGGDLRAVFWAATAPAALSVATLVAGVREPRRPSALSARRPDAADAEGEPGPEATGALLRRGDLLALGRRFWWLIAILSALAAARLSEAFLLLDAHRLGLQTGRVPLVLLVLSAAFAASSYPSGVVSDRVGRTRVLVAGFATLAAASGVLAAASSPLAVFAGAAIWGLHMGLTQATLGAVVSDLAPTALRGTAFGVLHLALGLGSLGANLLAGALWQNLGAGATFAASAALALVALGGLVAWLRGGTRGIRS